jgi:membrane protein DedA with SNARE-associated domain
MDTIIESLGYLGAYLGAILEGEILFLTAVQMATLGYLNFWGVLIAVFLGTLSADWLFYWAGRSQGKKYIQRFPRLQPRFERMDRRLQRFDSFFLFTYRFMYGFRIVLPVLFGVRGIAPWRFGLFSLVATSAWVALFGTLGYYFTDRIMGRIKIVQEYSWVGVILVIVLVLFFTFYPVQRERNE